MTTPRSCPRTLLAAPLLWVALGAGPAAADTLSISVRSPVSAPGRAALVLTASEEVRSLSVDLRPSRPQAPGPGDSAETAPVHGAQGRLAPGAQVVFPLGTGRPGRTLWTGTVSAQVGGRPFQREISVEALVTTAAHITYDDAHFHPEERYLEFQSSQPVRSAAIRVLGEDGGEIGAGHAEYGAGRPGAWLRVSWSGATGKALRLDLTVTDTAGYQRTVHLSRWSEIVPHDEINFATGSWEVPASEQAKLEESARRILSALGRVRVYLTPNLYIAGHTDTVGSEADNLSLSKNRARAIAQHLQRLGVDAPIFFAGFGEGRLRVQTGDNVDEPRNRRADYVLGMAPPVRGPRWERLGGGAPPPSP